MSTAANFQLDAATFLEHCFLKPATGFRPLRNTKLCGKRCPETEYERYVDITNVLNRSRHCHGFRFIPIHEKGADGAKNRVWAAAWPDKEAPPKRFVTSRPTELRLEPIHRCSMDIPVICYSADEIIHDPFYDFHLSYDAELEADGERISDRVLWRVQNAFRCQHRKFCYAILFFGYSARILRVDHAGITFSTHINCAEDATHLIDFLRNFSQASPADRGVDPTAEHIPHDSPLAEKMRLRAQLNKDPGTPLDHPRDVFERSLDVNWPWFKLPIGEGASRREFLVACPHYEREGSLPDTGARGYIALDMGDPDQGLVFLKDMWRPNKLGRLPEGDTVARLNAAGVKHVPTLVCHGVVDGQTTLSHRLAHREVVVSREHYRVAMFEVAKPLKEFSDSKELLNALMCCIIAHCQAMEIPILHRDISSGNILLVWNPELKKWEGMLTDWEIATDFTEKCHYRGRPMTGLGTSAFAAGRWLSPGRGSPEREAEDDLEGLLHVLVYLAVTHIPSNLKNVGAFIQRYFNEDGYSAMKNGSYRLRCIEEGKILISEKRSGTELQFALPSGAAGRSTRRPRYTHPLNNVIQQLFEWLRARYEALPWTSAYRYYGPPEGSDSETFTAERILELLGDAVQDPQWPTGDKCEDRRPKDFHNTPIERTDIRMVLPDDVPIPRPKKHERPEVKLPAAKRRRRA